MATLARTGAVTWTVLAAGLSLLGFACEPAATPQPSQVGGATASDNGTSQAAGGRSASSKATGGTKSKTSAAVTANGGAETEDGTSSSSGGVSTSTKKGSSSKGGDGNSSAKPSSSEGGSSGKSGSGSAVGSGGAGNSSSKADPTKGGSAGAPSTGGQPGSNTGVAPSGWYNPDFVEFVGEDCEVGEPKDVNNAKLPDLFEFFDGTRMSKKSEWRCRRAELKKAVEKYIHGTKPGKPTTVTGSVSKSSIKVHVDHNSKSIDFSVSVSLPSGASGPVPAIIGLAGGSLDKAVLSSEGVATISYDHSALASETSRSGLFTNIYGSTGASAQVAWAWGVSRIIDVLIAEKEAGRNDIIDPTGIGVTGCSRLGKGAFTIGAFDERIALGIPQESGTGGVSAFRVVNTNPMGPNGKPAQSLDSAWSEAQGWFGTAFGSYKGKVNTIPADTHSLVAMYAPRGLLVLDNSRIGELGSVAQHAASAAGGEVYEALGAAKNIEYHGGNADDPHNHCQFYPSQAEPLKRAIRAHLTRKAAADGRIEPAKVATADMTKWVDWETPTLE